MDDTQTLDGASSPERFARVRAVFEAVLEQPRERRGAYVAQACSGDAALLREVTAMLAGNDRAEGWLEPPKSPSSAPDEGRFPAGTVLAGRYRVLGLLGKGGMGEVYKAFDLILNQVVALKFLNPSHLSEATLVRFRNEARIARQVSHPNVCRVYDLGMVEGLHFLSMEFIDGEDLASLLRRIGRLPQDKAMEFTRKICAGLGAAHDRGVLHRDLKPANIMIDGRGQPRITDFGLAGLQEEIPLSDLRSGTPAYMSPEQKAGREVTTRSDIYSLGLVLHEMFTGKQRKGGESNPTDHVKDLDPMIERLILRCLEEEPSRRPQSALKVAMGLPGADPIAAALAAGETPSPEMVAASEEKEGFSIRAAGLWFAVLLAAWGGGVAWQTRTGLPAKAPVNLPPDAMAEKARQILRSAGYTKAPESAVYGYVCCTGSSLTYVAGLPPAKRDEALATHRPAIMKFYYRQGQNPLPAAEQDLFPDQVAYDPETIRMEQDAEGRLMRLEVSPEREDAPVAGPPDWKVFFEYAGLDMNRFVTVAPDSNPRLPLEQLSAWRGDWGAERPERVRVEAGSRNGRMALFRVVPEISSNTPSTEGPLDWMRLAILVLVMMGALIAAIRNSRQGRQDRKGAFILTFFAVVLILASAILGPIHIGRSVAVLYSITACLLVWPLYVSAEPLVRRYWPDALISWTRFRAGRRDSLVASHLLAAATVAVFIPAVAWPMVDLAGDTEAYWMVTTQAIANAGSFGGMVALWMTNAAIGLGTGLALVFAVTQLRLVIRKLWLADMVAIIPLSFLFTGPSVGLLVVAPLWLLDLWLLRRLGFLAFVAAWVLQTAMIFMTQSAAGWIATPVLVHSLIPVAVGVWALWVIVSDRRDLPDGQQ